MEYPGGTGEFKPDKSLKGDERWNKISGSHEGGTVGEAGTPHALAVGGCQSVQVRIQQAHLE